MFHYAKDSGNWFQFLPARVLRQNILTKICLPIFDKPAQRPTSPHLHYVGNLEKALKIW